MTDFTILKKLQRFIPLIAIGFLVLAVVVARHQLKAFKVTHVRDLILSVPPTTALLAMACTMLGYVIITFYDRIALRYVNKNVTPAKSMLAAFVSFAISHNAGHPLVSGTSLRYRFYLNWGVSGVEIIKISLFDSLSYGLGLLSVFLIAYGTAGVWEIDVSNIEMVDLVATLFAGIFIIYCLAVLIWKPALSFRQISLQLPNPKLTVLQILVGSGDVICAGLVLYIFFSSTFSMPLPLFFIIFIMSQLMGNFSQIPGGLGVFEGMFLHFLSPTYPAGDILASLILYRIVYYFLPLAIAGVLLLAHEIKDTRLGLRYRIFKRSRFQ